MITFESVDELEIGSVLPPLAGKRADKTLVVANLLRVMESGHYLYEVGVTDDCLSPPRGLGCAPADGKAVHAHRTGKWFFWDETWSDEIGPYDSEAEAEAACRQYAERL